jgi:hypothetical protein
MIFLIQEWLIVVIVFCLLAENAKLDMFRSPNAIGELYTCTRHPVLLMGEGVTANTQKRPELCQYKAG